MRSRFIDVEDRLTLSSATADVSLTDAVNTNCYRKESSEGLLLFGSSSGVIVLGSVNAKQGVALQAKNSIFFPCKNNNNKKHKVTQ